MSKFTVLSMASRVCLSSVILLMMVTTTCVSAEETPGTMGTNAPVSLEILAQLQGDKLEDYLSQLWIDRFTLGQQLLQGLSTATTTESKLSIVYLLGLYRMEQAVPMLSSMITLHDDGPVRVSTRISMLEGYPVVEALARIGNPAVPAMLKNIETSEDATVRELSVFVIQGVYGIELTRCYLQIALEKQADPTIKDRLAQAIEQLPQ